MTEEQIIQKAEEYGGVAPTVIKSVRVTAFIAGAHSRDEEIKELWDKIKKLESYRARLQTGINLLNDQLRNPWISVEDRLPDDNQVVLAHHEIIIDGGGEHKEDENVTIQRYVGKWITDRMEQQRMGKWLFDIKDRVTHWMPMPKV